MARLDGKIAIVSGGAQWDRSGGLPAVCRRRCDCHRGGYQCRGRSGRLPANSAAPPVFASLDVRDEASWEALVNGVIERHGRLDILVNNAGILSTTRAQSIDEASLEEWRAVNAVNVEGVFLGCRTAVKAMKESGGAIVNLSSIAGLIGTPLTVAYGASKGAVRQLTKSVAVDCGRKGYRIRCNSVSSRFCRDRHGTKFPVDVGVTTWMRGAQGPY